MIKCNKCHVEKEEKNFPKRYSPRSGYETTCNECKNIKRRENYKKNPEKYLAKSKEWFLKNRARKKVKIFKSEEHKFKSIARGVVNNAIRLGKIKKGLNCQFCNIMEDLEAHHSDYSKPLEIVWLCVKCHRSLHKSLNRRGKNASCRI